jgi:hypothetical protein
MSDFLLVAASFTLSRSRVTPRFSYTPTAYVLMASNPETDPHDIPDVSFLAADPDFHQLTAASDAPKS